MPGGDDLIRLGRQLQIACPKCGAMVDAEKLAERKVALQRLDAALGLPDDWPNNCVDSAITWKGLVGFGRKFTHDTACGCCGTTRREYP